MRREEEKRGVEGEVFYNSALGSKYKQQE